MVCCKVVLKSIVRAKSFKRFVSLLFLFLIAVTSVVRGNPELLWKGYDPDTGDFKEEIVSQKTEAGIYYRDSYISAYVQGEEIRVFCKYAVKAGATQAPGFMDVHGWMGAPRINNFMVQNGWAVIAHDYTGKTQNRPHYTKYPPKLRYGNMDGKVGYRVKTKLPNGSFINDPRQTEDYLWYAIQRRVLSYFLTQKEVNKDQIGAQGMSYGGNLMWNLGMDPRVKAVISYFGIGWVEYFRNRQLWMYDLERTYNPEPNAGEILYLAHISPQAHAPHMKAATLWLNGTNDHTGGHERGETSFTQFQPNVPWAYAHDPRRHNDTRSIQLNGFLWLNKYVRGHDLNFAAQPESKIVLDKQGVAEIHITPADPDQVTDLKIYQAIENPSSHGRAWRDVKAVRQGNIWIGKLPVMDVEKYVFSYANVRYKNQFVRSTRFTAAIPAHLGKAVATDTTTTRFNNYAAWSNSKLIQGKDGINGFQPLNIHGAVNEQFSDPKWKAPSGAQLSFRYQSAKPQNLEFIVDSHNRATVTVPGGEGWQVMTLQAPRLTNRFTKKPMRDWSACKKVYMRSAPGSDISKMTFSDFEWVIPAAPHAEVASLKKVTWPEDRRVYLTQQLASSIESPLGVKNDTAWAGGKIRVSGKAYEKGLGTHSDSKIIYRLDGQFATFNVVAGPDDSSHGLIEMKIFVDGEEKWWSGPTRSHDNAFRRRLTISVKDADVLVLSVDQSDGNIGGDHASWANAYLERVPRVASHDSKNVEIKSLAHTKDQLEPFLKTYCYRCHGERRQRGQVRFDNVSWDITNNDSAQRWQDVLDQLNGGDMPPEDSKMPDDDELSEALDALTGAVVEAKQRLTSHGGEITMRRLNRREYSASIQDLFGFGVDINEIPEDGEIASFDTVGAEQFFTSSHFEKYLDLGKRVANSALNVNTHKRKPAKALRKEVEENVTAKMRENLADLDRKMALKKQGADWKQMGFKDEGEAEIIFRQWQGRAELPRQYLQLPKVDTGVYITDVSVFTTIVHHTDIRGEYILRVRGGVHGRQDPIRRIARFFDRKEIYGTVEMLGTPETPETVELRIKRTLGNSFLGVSVRENVPDYTLSESMRGYLHHLQGPADQTDPRASIWIDWMEIDGPFYPEKRPRFEDIIYPGVETGSVHSYIWDEKRTREFVEKFVFEAFRRKELNPNYIDQLLALHSENRKAGMSHREALVEIISIVLASPGFLFIQERDPNLQAETDTLNDLELASRLSYFLWSSPPDDELYAFAKAGGLSTPAILEAQVNRMLADPKSKALRDGFMSQWAEFDRYDAITVDNKEHIRFNEGVRQDAKQEVLEFFGTLIDENLPVSYLVDSNFVMINSALAVHYGIDLPKSRSGAFQKYLLPEGSPRGGLMTQAAFLTTGSNGERSSPVIRGALVMEKLLHDEPAPPPPNVPELGTSDETPRTNREMVEMHQEQAVCASCHRKMDVIGFGLENFDTTGRWRDTELLGKEEVPIDPAGTLPNGSGFSTVQELKEVLIEQEDELAHQVVESLLTYALGRTIEFSDADNVEALLKKLRPESYRVRSIIREIALSPMFKSK